VAKKSRIRVKAKNLRRKKHTKDKITTKEMMGTLGSMSNAV
jgi:hypothetical protein